MKVDNPQRGAYSIDVDNQNVVLGTNPAVSEFIDRLIAEKNFPDLTPEVKEELRWDLSERLDDFIAAKVIATLSDENVAKFETMLKEGRSEGEIQTFVTENIPNFTDFLTQVLLEFKEVYLGVVPALPAEPPGQPANQPTSDTKE